MEKYENNGGAYKIKNFTNLNAYKEAHKLVLIIYKVTNKFPQDEKYGLINQMRRAAVSIASNIAEGFSRNTIKDKYQFYTLALGSLSELQSQLLIAKDLKYLNQQTFNQIAQQSITVRKLISGLKRIKYQNEKINTEYRIQNTEYRPRGVAALITVLSLGGLIMTISLGMALISFWTNLNIKSIRDSNKAFMPLNLAFKIP